MGANRAAPRPAVFLDRDGVINRNVFNPATGSHEAPLTAADFVLVPGATQALHQLQAAGFLLFIVSNQPNYAKGKSTLKDLAAIDTRMRRELTSSGITLSAIYYCLHHPNGIIPEYTGPCACRKPSPYFLLCAIRQFHLAPGRSWMIGDRETDILCGHAAGVRTILVSAEPASLYSNTNFAIPTEVEGPALLSRVHQHWSCSKSRRDPQADFTALDLLAASNQILASQQQSSPASASASNSTRRNPDSRPFASYHSCGV